MTRRRYMNTGRIAGGGILISSYMPYDQMRTNRVFQLSNGKNFYEYFSDNSFEFLYSSSGNTPQFNIKIDAIASDYRVILFSDGKRSDMETIGKGVYIYKVNWIGSPFFIDLAYDLTVNELHNIYKDLGFDLVIENNQYLSVMV